MFECKSAKMITLTLNRTDLSNRISAAIINGSERGTLFTKNNSFYFDTEYRT